MNMDQQRRVKLQLITEILREAAKVVSLGGGDIAFTTERIREYKERKDEV